jgi:hypothetical protein
VAFTCRKTVSVTDTSTESTTYLILYLSVYLPAHLAMMNAVCVCMCQSGGPGVDLRSHPPEVRELAAARQSGRDPCRRPLERSQTVRLPAGAPPSCHSSKRWAPAHPTHPPTDDINMGRGARFCEVGRPAHTGEHSSCMMSCWAYHNSVTDLLGPALRHAPRQQPELGSASP